MTSLAGSASLPAVRIAWLVLAVWAFVVFLYAAYRSRGEARPDPIRPSGPILGEDRPPRGRGAQGETATS